MMSTAGLLEQTVRRWPDRVALVEGAHRPTYQAWYEDIRRLARGLLDSAVRPGDRIATLMANSIDQVTLYLAANHIGAVVVPLNTRLAVDDIRYILNDSGPVLFAFDESFAPVIERLRPEFSAIRLWVCRSASADPGVQPFTELFASGQVTSPPAPMGDDEPATIMYTSGTTGWPKGVVQTRRGEWINALVCALELGFGAEDRALHIAPMFHAAGWHNLFLPLLVVGGTHVMVERFDPEDVLAIIERERITTFVGVPTHFHLLRQAQRVSERDLSSLRICFAGGAPTSVETVQWIQQHLCPNLGICYGQTEATSLITYLPPEQIHRMGSLSSIGRSLVSMEIRLVRTDIDNPSPDDLVPLGEPGQLIARGPKLMREYWQNPSKTAEALRNGWLYTGDLCVQDTDGYCYFLGRVDDRISSGGEHIYPLEVEQVLNQHAGVKESAVVGVPDPIWGTAVWAFVVRDDEELTADDITRYCRESGRLATYKRPRVVRFVHALPKSPIGKILKKELVATVRDQNEGA